jgi:hypothetical protein
MDEKQDNEQVVLSKTHTSCKNCAFADYDGKTQTGCKVGKLDCFSDDQIIEAFDSEKEFYIINDRICLWKRSKDWAEKNKDSYENVISQEISPRYEVLIFFNSSHSFEDLEKTCKSILAQQNKPEHITVLQMNAIIDPLKTYELFDSLGIKWRIERMTVERTEDEYLDVVISNAHYAPHYVRLHAGKELPPSFYPSLQTIVVDEMRQFMALSDVTDDWVLFSRLAHDLLGGNKEKPLMEKIDKELCLKLNETLQESQNLRKITLM